MEIYGTLLSTIEVILILAAEQTLGYLAAAVESEIIHQINVQHFECKNNIIDSIVVGVRMKYFVVVLFSFVCLFTLTMFFGKFLVFPLNLIVHSFLYIFIICVAIQQLSLLVFPTLHAVWVGNGGDRYSVRIISHFE